MDIKTILVETIGELERMRAAIDARLRDLRAAAWEMGCQPAAEAPAPERAASPSQGMATDIRAEIKRQRAAIMEEVDRVRTAAMAQAAEAQRMAASGMAGGGVAAGMGRFGVPPGALDGFRGDAPLPGQERKPGDARRGQ